MEKGKLIQNTCMTQIRSAKNMDQVDGGGKG